MLAIDAQRMRLVLALRQAGVTDSRLLAAIERTPRNAFIPGHLANLAWDDAALPLEGGQILTKPGDVARVLTALSMSGIETLLEIGTGSGWQAAIIAKLAREVITLERRRPLAEAAVARFLDQTLDNVRLRYRDGRDGLAEGGPYDRIVINGAIAEVPAALLEQLKPGGVLVAPVGAGGVQRLMRYRNDPAGVMVVDLGPIAFLPLEAGVDED